MPPSDIDSDPQDQEECAQSHEKTGNNADEDFFLEFPGEFG